MTAPPSLIVFGGTGDLSQRKLIPALYQMFCHDRLPEVKIIGVARTPLDDAGFRNKLSEAVRQHAASDWQAQRWQAFARHLFYVSADAARPDGMPKLQECLQRLEDSKAAPRLYYLAVAPRLYSPIAGLLCQAGMTREEGGVWRRLVIEKPFGRDLASARALNQELHACFREDQIYRIDHYLGKETVQNVLVFRFANTLFEPVWDYNFIDHVQITVAESRGVEQRGDYYDQVGVLRDMFQNHLLQLLTLVAMEAPLRFAADPLRSEKIKVLDAIPIPTVKDAAAALVCGQYAGYRLEPGMSPQSRTPTFAALRLEVNNWRWRGVPFYLRSGKCLARRASEIIIQFHCPPHLMFPMPPGTSIECNRLALCIQPDEGIHLSFQTKVPGQNMQLAEADMEFHYRQRYPKLPIPDAYERLLQDALHGDATLFTRSDEIERAWEIIEPFIRACEEPDAPRPETYAVGSSGPDGAKALLAHEGRSWQEVCVHP